MIAPYEKRNRGGDAQQNGCLKRPPMMAGDLLAVIVIRLIPRVNFRRNN
jgi:hypothetical protein